jgi:hypothetical protein
MLFCVLCISASLFEQFKPLIGEDSIQFANDSEGRKRHQAYTKCYAPDVLKQYYSTFERVSYLLYVETANIFWKTIKRKPKYGKIGKKIK